MVKTDRVNSTIALKNVSKSFRKNKVLDNISTEFEGGKIHGIIGHNGGGKTVLLKTICGLMAAEGGEIFIGGKRLKCGRGCDFNIGAIIENPGFLPLQSGIKNLKYLASIRQKITFAEISAVMERVGLDPKEKKKVGSYSLGMRQRLGLAQATMENPDLLILDEPMNGLDKAGVADMRKYLLDLKDQGKTILLASHSSEDIDVLCDTVYEMDKGKLERIR